MDKGSNLLDGMVACKWQDSIDLYKFEIGDIYWKRATLNIMTFALPFRIFDVFGASVDDESRIPDG